MVGWEENRASLLVYLHVVKCIINIVNGNISIAFCELLAKAVNGLLILPF